jgi:hypothetical protein
MGDILVGWWIYWVSLEGSRKVMELRSNKRIDLFNWVTVFD